MFKEVCKAKLSLKVLIFPLLLIVLFAIVTSSVDEESGVASIGGVFVLIAIYKAIKLNTTFIVLYDKKIKGRVGVLRKKVLDAPLDKINDISIEYGLLGRFLGYGDIVISTSSTEIEFVGISNCEEFKDKVIQQIEIYKNEKMEEQAKLMAEAMKNINK